MRSEILSIFSDILVVCGLELLSGTHFSLDGVKLSANASKVWSGTIDELKHDRDQSHHDGHDLRLGQKIVSSPHGGILA